MTPLPVVATLIQLRKADFGARSMDASTNCFGFAFDDAEQGQRQEGGSLRVGGMPWRRAGGTTEGVAMATATRIASSGEKGRTEELGRAGVEEASCLLGGGSGQACIFRGEQFMFSGAYASHMLPNKRVLLRRNK